MGLPHYAVELASARLSAAHLRRSAIQAEIYDPAGAVEAATVAEARRLGALPGSAYRFTKLALHQALADRVLANLDADMQKMVPPTP